MDIGIESAHEEGSANDVADGGGNNVIDNSACD